MKPIPIEESNRKRDCLIAEHLYGWKMVDVPPDARGENACRVLAWPGIEKSGYEWPPIGRISEFFLCPSYSTKIEHAMDVVLTMNLKGWRFDCVRWPNQKLWRVRFEKTTYLDPGGIAESESLPEAIVGAALFALRLLP